MPEAFATANTHRQLFPTIVLRQSWRDFAVGQFSEAERAFSAQIPNQSWSKVPPARFSEMRQGTAGTIENLATFSVVFILRAEHQIAASDVFLQCQERGRKRPT